MNIFSSSCHCCNPSPGYEVCSILGIKTTNTIACDLGNKTKKQSDQLQQMYSAHYRFTATTSSSALFWIEDLPSPQCSLSMHFMDVGQAFQFCTHQAYFLCEQSIPHTYPFLREDGNYSDFYPLRLNRWKN